MWGTFTVDLSWAEEDQTNVMLLPGESQMAT